MATDRDSSGGIQEPDEELILAAQSNNRKAMTTLLTEWNEPIFGFLMRMLKNRADAEDATQETFLRVVKGLPNYKHSGNFRAWIYRIARNQAALTASRRQRIEQRETGVEPYILDSINDGDEYESDYPEYVNRLRKAIEELPVREREVVTLRLVNELKFVEIAKHTDTSINTVLGRMRNATKRLSEKLKRQL